MNEIIERASRAFFVDDPRLDSECLCQECLELNEIIANRSPLDVPKEVSGTLCLLSGEALRYFTPGLMKICMEEGEGYGDLSVNYQTILSAPISKKSPPHWHPTYGRLNLPQTEIIYDFLCFLNESWFVAEKEEPGREWLRMMENWKWFLECAKN